MREVRGEEWEGGEEVIALFNIPGCLLTLSPERLWLRRVLEERRKKRLSFAL